MGVQNVKGEGEGIHLFCRESERRKCMAVMSLSILQLKSDKGE